MLIASQLQTYVICSHENGPPFLPALVWYLRKHISQVLHHYLNIQGAASVSVMCSNFEKSVSATTAVQLRWMSFFNAQSYDK